LKRICLRKPEPFSNSKIRIYSSALYAIHFVIYCRGRFPWYFNVSFGNQRFNFFKEGFKVLCAEGLAFAFGILGLGGGIVRMPNVYASEAWAITQMPILPNLLGLVVVQ